MAELADRVLLSRSGLTRLVDRLQAEGYVRRERSPDDARGTFTVLTPAGLAALRTAAPVHLAGVQRALAGALHRRGARRRWARCCERGAARRTHASERPPADAGPTARGRATRSASASPSAPTGSPSAPRRWPPGCRCCRPACSRCSPSPAARSSPSSASSPAAAVSRPRSAAGCCSARATRSTRCASRRCCGCAARAGSLAALGTIDESTAMAVAQPERAAGPRRVLVDLRRGLHRSGTSRRSSGRGGRTPSVDPAAIGLDAVVPAAFLALLAPRLRAARWSGASRVGAPLHRGGADPAHPARGAGARRARPRCCWRCSCDDPVDPGRRHDRRLLPAQAGRATSSRPAARPPAHAASRRAACRWRCSARSGRRRGDRRRQPVSIWTGRGWPASAVGAVAVWRRAPFLVSSSLPR